MLPDDDARRVWADELDARLVIEDLPQHDGLPQLHQRLVELGVDVPYLPKLLGVRRHVLARNAPMLAAARGAVEVLENVGASPVLVGDAAVVLGLHGQLDRRPLHDIDVVVPSSEAGSAAAGLARAGWRRVAAWHDGFLLDVRAQRFVGPADVAVNLRWSDATLYAGMVGVSAGDLPVASPTDSFVYTLLDGSRLTGPTFVRWALDALAAVQSPSGVDWDRVAEAATERHAGPSVWIAVEQLSDVMPIAVPADVRRRLMARSPGRLARAGTTRRPGTATAFVRRTTGAGVTAPLTTLLPYLCEVWDLTSPRQLPGELARRLRRRAVRR